MRQRSSALPVPADARNDPAGKGRTMTPFCCPGCSQEYRGPEGWPGDRIRCTNCGEEFVTPVRSREEPPSPVLELLDALRPWIATPRRRALAVGTVLLCIVLMVGLVAWGRARTVPPKPATFETLTG